ncbi:hypothetical protein KX816_20325 [Sphingosinicellaceae bacterium]|nr:hypothetical protein KX816_20325 [Sphingosinicellaceae bacterium]
MATKGVLLSTLIDCSLIMGGVEMNPSRQGRFTAGSRVAIWSLEWFD